MGFGAYLPAASTNGDHRLWLHACRVLHRIHQRCVMGAYRRKLWSQDAAAQTGHQWSCVAHVADSTKVHLALALSQIDIADTKLLVNAKQPSTPASSTRSHIQTSPFCAFLRETLAEVSGGRCTELRLTPREKRQAMQCTDQPRPA